jgi:hypothetical protein
VERRRQRQMCIRDRYKVARETSDTSAISIMDIFFKPVFAINCFVASRIAFCVRR